MLSRYGYIKMQVETDLHGLSNVYVRPLSSPRAIKFEQYTYLNVSHIPPSRRLLDSIFHLRRAIETPVIGLDQNITTMKNSVTAPWNLGISRNDVEKLLKGFKPTAMEDRWMCRADTPDARGDFVVHVFRSWTGDEVLRMNVVLAALDGDGASADTDERHATITDLTWDRGEGSFLATEVEAKNLATSLCRGLLGCDL